MPKKHNHNHISASFHYLKKWREDQSNKNQNVAEAFTDEEFARVIDAVSAPRSLDIKKSDVVEKLKIGTEIPFGNYLDCGKGVHFGSFEGAYFGQRYRNNLKGEIPADSVNLREFNYILTKMRSGIILVGVTYHGLYGDYTGLWNFLRRILKGNHKISSIAIKSVSDELGSGEPTEIKLSWRKNSDRPEHRPLFGNAGVIAIRKTDVGKGFGEHVRRIANSVSRDRSKQKKILADIVNEGSIIEVDESEIQECSAIVRQNGKNKTIYLIGQNDFATRFILDVPIKKDGMPDKRAVKDAMIHLISDKIVPLLAE